SPLSAFYLGAAFHKLGRAADADRWISRAWSRPAAEASLTAWGRKHTGLAAEAETLGNDLLQLLPVADSEPPQLVLAARTLKLALALNPALELARLGWANAQERRGDYHGANDTLSGLIDHSGTPKRGQPSALLRVCLGSRARVATKWGATLTGR